MIDKLEEILVSSGFKPLEKSVLENFSHYYQAVCTANEVMNLTTLTTPEAFIKKHILDSLYLLDYLQPGEKVLDLGSGLGVPGLVLKLAKPELNLSVIDALEKRIKFLEQMVATFNLQTVEMRHGRFEDLGREKDWREAYDLTLARGVADLPVLLEYALPFTKVGGRFIAMKGANVEDEVERSLLAIGFLGGRLEKVEFYTLPDGEKRALVIITKNAHTPDTYPRKPKMIKNKPL